MLPFSLTMASVSFCVWLSGSILMEQTRLHISEQIREAEKQIEGLEAMNDVIAAEVEHLRGS